MSFDSQIPHPSSLLGSSESAGDESFLPAWLKILLALAVLGVLIWLLVFRGGEAMKAVTRSVANPFGWV